MPIYVYSSKHIDPGNATFQQHTRKPDRNYFYSHGAMRNAHKKLCRQFKWLSPFVEPRCTMVWAVVTKAKMEYTLSSSINSLGLYAFRAKHKEYWPKWISTTLWREKNILLSRRCLSLLMGECFPCPALKFGAEVCRIYYKARRLLITSSRLHGALLADTDAPNGLLNKHTHAQT